MHQKIGLREIQIFRNILLKWYSKNGRKFPWRKKRRSKYEIIVSEILLQRTRAETVEKYYDKFLYKYPSWKSLNQINSKSLQRDLKPLGLWRQRSQAFQSLSKVVNGLHGRIPREREKLEQLPGIGQYIANAILMIFHGKREPLLDVNMARLLERFFGPRKLSDIRYDPYLQTLSRKIQPRKNIKEFNWAVLDFAASICTAKNPNHNNCPLRNRCSFLKVYK
jgi:A/G-specific adenine glycosylase